MPSPNAAHSRGLRTRPMDAPSLHARYAAKSDIVGNACQGSCSEGGNQESVGIVGNKAWIAKRLVWLCRHAQHGARCQPAPGAAERLRPFTHRTGGRAPTSPRVLETHIRSPFLPYHPFHVTVHQVRLLTPA